MRQGKQNDQRRQSWGTNSWEPRQSWGTNSWEPDQNKECTWHENDNGWEWWEPYNNGDTRRHATSYWYRWGQAEERSPVHTEPTMASGADAFGKASLLMRGTPDTWLPAFRKAVEILQGLLDKKQESNADADAEAWLPAELTAGERKKLHITCSKLKLKHQSLDHDGARLMKVWRRNKNDDGGTGLMKVSMKGENTERKESCTSRSPRWSPGAHHSNSRVEPSRKPAW